MNLISTEIDRGSTESGSTSVLLDGRGAPSTESNAGPVAESCLSIVVRVPKGIRFQGASIIRRRAENTTPRSHTRVNTKLKTNRFACVGDSDDVVHTISSTTGPAASAGFNINPDHTIKATRKVALDAVTDVGGGIASAGIADESIAINILNASSLSLLPVALEVVVDTSTASPDLINEEVLSVLLEACEDGLSRGSLESTEIDS